MPTACPSCYVDNNGMACRYASLAPGDRVCVWWPVYNVAFATAVEALNASVTSALTANPLRSSDAYVLHACYQFVLPDHNVVINVPASSFYVTLITSGAAGGTGFYMEFTVDDPRAVPPP